MRFLLALSLLMLLIAGNAFAQNKIFILTRVAVVPAGCTGAINVSEGCPTPMLGM